MYCHPVGEGPRGTGAVVHVKLDPTPRREHSSPAATPRMPLPGLVGSDPVWLRACRQVEAASRSGEWLVVSGEPGVGKLALVQAVQLRRQPIRHLEVLDAADAGSTPGWFRSLRDALAAPHPSVVIRHVDTLDRVRLRELISTLGSAVGPQTAARPGSPSPWAG